MNEKREAAASLRNLGQAVGSTIRELRELQRFATPEDEPAIAASLQRVMAAKRHLARALVEIHKGIKA